MRVGMPMPRLTYMPSCSSFTALLTILSLTGLRGLSWTASLSLTVTFSMCLFSFWV